MQEDKEMAKYYTGVVVKQTGEKENTYHMHDAVLIQEKRSNNDAVKQDGIGNLTGSRPATPKNPSIAKILESIAEYNKKTVKMRRPGHFFRCRRKWNRPRI